jgi:hypothetical protein
VGWSAAEDAKVPNLVDILALTTALKSPCASQDTKIPRYQRTSQSVSHAAKMARIRAFAEQDRSGCGTGWLRVMPGSARIDDRAASLIYVHPYTSCATISDPSTRTRTNSRTSHFSANPSRPALSLPANTVGRSHPTRRAYKHVPLRRERSSVRLRLRPLTGG